MKEINKITTRRKFTVTTTALSFLFILYSFFGNYIYSRKVVRIWYLNFF